MTLVVAILLALFVLDRPWDVVVLVVATGVELAEIWFWFWYSKRRRIQVGAETLIGARGVAVGAIAPRGQVRLQGELWDARSPSPLAAGAQVVVEGRDGLTLLVREAD